MNTSRSDGVTGVNTLRPTLDEALQQHQAGNLARAEALYRQILQQWPGQPDALNLLGVMANQVGQPETAIDLIGQAVAQLPDEPDFHGNFAAALQVAGRVADAIVHYREAIRLKPEGVSNYLFLSDALLEAGHVDAALAHALYALQLDASSALAYCVLGELAGHGSYRLTEEQIEHMQALLRAGGLPAQDGSMLAFTLATHWERMGRFHEAFACYARANELKREVYRQANQMFDRDKHRALIDGLIGVFTPELLERTRHLGIDSEVPVFVVGMVRSGTTLVEQILASHPEVHGAGERKEIDQLATNLTVASGGVVSGDWSSANIRHSPPTTHQRYPACVPLLDAGTAQPGLRLLAASEPARRDGPPDRGQNAAQLSPPGADRDALPAGADHPLPARPDGRLRVGVFPELQVDAARRRPGRHRLSPSRIFAADGALAAGAAGADS